MRLIHALLMDDPSKGTRMLAHDLADAGLEVGRARVRRPMQAVCIKPVYCMPRTTVLYATKHKHPYLLGGVKIER